LHIQLSVTYKEMFDTDLVDKACLWSRRYKIYVCVYMYYKYEEYKQK